MILDGTYHKKRIPLSQFLAIYPFANLFFLESFDRMYLKRKMNRSSCLITFLLLQISKLVVILSIFFQFMNKKINENEAKIICEEIEQQLKEKISGSQQYVNTAQRCLSKLREYGVKVSPALIQEVQKFCWSFCCSHSHENSAIYH